MNQDYLLQAHSDGGDHELSRDFNASLGYSPDGPLRPGKNLKIVNNIVGSEDLQIGAIINGSSEADLHDNSCTRNYKLNPHGNNKLS